MSKKLQWIDKAFSCVILLSASSLLIEHKKLRLSSFQLYHIVAQFKVRRSEGILGPDPDNILSFHAQPDRTFHKYLVSFWGIGSGSQAVIKYHSTRGEICCQEWEECNINYKYWFDVRYNFEDWFKICYDRQYSYPHWAYYYKRHVIAHKLFQTFTFLQLMLKPRALLQRMAAWWRCRRVGNQNMMTLNSGSRHAHLTPAANW